MKTVNTNSINVANEVAELICLKYNQLLDNTDEYLICLLESKEGKLDNRKEYELIVGSLKEDRIVYAKLVQYVAKHIVMSSVKQLPLGVLLNMTAEKLVGRAPANRMRIASAIVHLLGNSEAFTVYKIINKEGHEERIVMNNYTINEATKQELLTRQYHSTNNQIVEATAKSAGHHKKQTADNFHMLPILQKLNSVAYTIDSRVWDRFKYELAAYRFEDMATQTAMVAKGDSLIGETFYFGHRFGIDNGRIYVDGDLITLHGGALNYVFKFADKRLLTARGLEVLRAKVAELEADIDKLSFKERVEFYSLSLDLIDGEQGKPVGTILHIDAKLSGLQHQCIATRNKSEALYCGLLSELSDGYGHIRNILSNKDALTRDMVKKAYNPYQYGAGEVATVRRVLEAGGKLDFKEWETAYKKAFPNAYNLRSFLLNVAKNYNSDTFTYTTPSGFNAVITALGTEVHYVNTCYGKIKYERKEIDAKHMGVKLLAAFSHMQDASSLHYVVDNADFDMHVIHDSFGSHPNDTDRVEELYINSLQNHLVRPILRDFIANIVGKELAEVNVGRLMSNTLQPADIVGGLY